MRAFSIKTVLNGHKRFFFSFSIEKNTILRGLNSVQTNIANHIDDGNMINIFLIEAISHSECKLIFNKAPKVIKNNSDPSSQTNNGLCGLRKIAIVIQIVPSNKATGCQIRVYNVSTLFFQWYRCYRTCSAPKANFNDDMFSLFIRSIHEKGMFVHLTDQFENTT